MRHLFWETWMIQEYLTEIRYQVSLCLLRITESDCARAENQTLTLLNSHWNSSWQLDLYILHKPKIRGWHMLSCHLTFSGKNSCYYLTVALSHYTNLGISALITACFIEILNMHFPFVVCKPILNHRGVFQCHCTNSTNGILKCVFRIIISTRNYLCFSRVDYFSNTGWNSLLALNRRPAMAMRAAWISGFISASSIQC